MTGSTNHFRSFQRIMSFAFPLSSRIVHFYSSPLCIKVTTEQAKSHLNTHFICSSSISTRFSSTLADNQNVDAQFVDGTQLAIIYGAIVLSVIVFIVLAFVDARCCRINDYFSAGSILQALVGFLDFLSDVLFAIQVSLIYADSAHDENPTKVLLLMVFAYFFIALPMTLGFVQLLRENEKEWTNSMQLRNWMEKNAYFVYTLSVLSGSAFNTVALVNCEAFNLNIFSMELSKRSKRKGPLEPLHMFTRGYPS